MGDDIDEQLRDRARALRADGLSRRQIAQTLGVSDYTVTRLLHGDVTGHPGLRARAKDEVRREARRLRSEGATYDEIAARLHTSKSTLSLWLRDLPVPPRSAREPEQLRAHSRLMHEARRVKVIEPRERERRERIDQATGAVGSISDRELLLLGAMAYWCEGTKGKPWRRRERVVFTNSDPRLVSLFLRWLHLVGVARSDVRCRVSIHESADVSAAEAFWANIVGIPVDELERVTLKRHLPSTNRRNTGDDYHGCLVITVWRSAALYQQIEGWVQGIADALGPVES